MSSVAIAVQGFIVGVVYEQNTNLFKSMVLKN